MQLCTFAHKISRGNRSTTWPRVNATVTESKIESTWAFINNVPVQSFHLHLRYEYKMQGQTFVGKRISMIDDSSTNVKNVETLKARYPVGTEVQPFVDPDDPEYAILKPGASLLWWILLSICSIGIVVLLAFAT